MKEIICQILLGFIFITALSPLAQAQGPPERKGREFRGDRGMRGPRHPPMMDWASQLKLTQDQTARIQELRESYLGDTLVWRNELVVKRFDLRDLLRNPQADPEVILGKQRDISQLEAKIEERALLYHLEIRKVLTPAQIRLLPPDGGWMYGPPHMRGRGRGREY